MAAPDSMSINVREATTAAVLVGAVVVVLGYASGLGLRTPFLQAVVATPPPAASSEVPVRSVPAPVAVAVPAPLPRVLPAAPAPVVPVQTYPAPVSPTWTPPPAPEPTCAPGLLGELLAPVTSLLGSVLDASVVPVARTTGAPDQGLLGGVLDSVLGSTCDTSATTKAHLAGAR